VVILNKNNSKGLKEALESLSKQKKCSICKCFDILVMDGGSTDPSMIVVDEFKKRYPCIEFRTQLIKGGVGPARIEAIDYAKKHGYKYIVWGDSENIYKQDYISSMLRCMNSNCDIVSGTSVVRHASLWTLMFFWYHAYHLLFGFTKTRHAPGNNKVVSIRVYNKVIYPPSRRSDDFYLSMLAHKRKFRFCNSESAIVKVAMPKNFRGIISWEKARIKGLVEGAYFTGLIIPPDFFPWFLFALSPLILVIGLLGLSGVFNFIHSGVPHILTSFYLGVIVYLAIRLQLLSKRVYEKPRALQGILSVLGMYLHSIFTTYYVVKFLISLSKEVEDLRRILRGTIKAFNISEALMKF